MTRALVTIDGPSGVGKSAQSLMLACLTGADHLSLGYLFRGMCLAATGSGSGSPDDAELVAGLGRVHYVPGGGTGWRRSRVMIDGTDVTYAILTDRNLPLAAARLAGRAAAQDAVRARAAGLVTAGRWVIEGRSAARWFPDADHRIWLTASAGARSQRRRWIAGVRGVDDDATYESAARHRDAVDDGRSVEPLGADAANHVVDSTGLQAEETLRVLLDLVGACDPDDIELGRVVAAIYLESEASPGRPCNGG
jgi:cytidylate kinase